MYHGSDGAQPQPPVPLLGRDNHANAGQAIIQLAPVLNTTPEKLFAALQRLPPGELDAWVKMALDLAPDKQGKIPTGPLPKDGDNVDSSAIKTTGGKHVHYEEFPRSLTTGAQYTRGLLALRGIML